MHLQPGAHQLRQEYRRYFPDWTDRSLRPGEELEADHNSYLAGGYAEEFGYLAEAGSFHRVPLIDGASPDDDAFRLVQWAVLHPGYPLRPYPISVDRKPVRRSTPLRSSGGVSHLGESGARGRGKFIRVTERPYERKHRMHKLVGALRRLLARSKIRGTEDGDPS